eukprot:TRINITY_DN13443_c0_g1_i1.p2 TRINITY_DN13443_c0_g1~~TRINITY_DN13443_c0_g1_i1.p2  ORF type:complete len:107 (+),score=45.41 TRINITY_DN13443_c0_g1_i1:102-422(+)
MCIRDSAYSAQHAWDGGDSQWALLEGLKAKGSSVQLRDLPQLTKQTIERAVLLEGKKTAFTKLAKRWHPDKFNQKFGSTMSEAERAVIMDRVKETFQLIQETTSKH